MRLLGLFSRLRDGVEVILGFSSNPGDEIQGFQWHSGDLEGVRGYSNGGTGLVRSKLASGMLYSFSAPKPSRRDPYHHLISRTTITYIINTNISSTH